MSCLCQGTTRRRVLAMLSATAALGGSALAQTNSPRIIDTHHHIYPPKYVEPNLDRLLRDTSTLPAAAYTSWTPQLALDQMEKADVADDAPLVETRIAGVLDLDALLQPVVDLLEGEFVDDQPRHLVRRWRRSRSHPRTNLQ